MVELAEHIKSKIEHEHVPSLFGAEEMADQAIKARNAQKQSDENLNVNLKNLVEEQRSVVGIHEIYGKIYEELGFEAVLKKPLNSEILKHIVMARIANLSSKGASVMQLEKDFGVSISLQSVYRMMDQLDSQAQKIMQDCAYNATKELFGGKIDVIFFDATTLYFESFEVEKLMTMCNFKDNSIAKYVAYSLHSSTYSRGNYE